MWRWFNSSDYFVRFSVAVQLWLRVTQKSYPSFSVKPQPFPLQYKHNHSTKCHTSELCAFVVLEPHQVLVWITDGSPRYNNNTNTRQNKTFFHNESQIFWRFSCITQNNAKTQNAKNIYVIALDRVMWRSISHLCVLAHSPFVLSYAIHFWVYLSQLEVERTDLTCQNQNFVFHYQFAMRDFQRRTAR